MDLPQMPPMIQPSVGHSATSDFNWWAQTSPAVQYGVEVNCAKEKTKKQKERNKTFVCSQPARCFSSKIPKIG